MSDLPKHANGEGERHVLAEAWNDALISKEPMIDSETKALLGGFNLRIDVVKSLKAVWKTAQLVISVGQAVVTHFANPLDYFTIPADVFSAIQASLDAVREPMTPLEYTACLTLSAEPNGMTPAELEQRLGKFLESGGFKEMPWYLRLTAADAEAARVTLRQPNGFENLMKLLRADQWLIEEGGKIRLQARNYTFNFKVG